jgi:hypothetical protein
MFKALSAFADRVRGTSGKPKDQVIQEVPNRNVTNRAHAHALERDTADITAQLQLMFPQLSEKAIDGVISELLKMYPHCSHNQLADLATSSLLEVRLMREQPQCAPVSAMEEDLVPGMISDLPTQSKADPSRAPPQQGSVMAELDRCLANMFKIPDHAMGPCLREIRKILQQIAAEPQGFCARHFAEYSSKPQFEKLVGRYPPAVALLCFAGFKEESGNERGLTTFVFVGDHKSVNFTAVLTTLQRLTAEEAPLVPIDLDEADPVEDVDEIVDCGSPSPTQVQQESDAVAFNQGRPDANRKPCRLTTLPPLSDSSSAKKQRAQPSKKTSSAVETSRSTTAPLQSSKSLAANWGVIRPAQGNGIAPQSTRPALLSSTEQNKATTDFDVLVQRALDGTNLHRAKKGLAPLTSLRCSAEESSLTCASGEADDVWTGDVVTIPDDNWTSPNDAEKKTIRKPAVTDGKWTADLDSEKKVANSHSIPAIFSGKGKLRGSKACAARRGK